MFNALLLDESADGVSASIQSLDEELLPEGDVVIAVEHSTLNYKDGMVIKGIGRLVRTYPHVPGIDLAGTVLTSEHPDHRPGDRVVVTGWRMGESRWGGFAQKARVRGDWIVPLPDGLTTRRAMAIGTAGLTAMLAITALENHGLAPGHGEVLVTGAAGGVGSIAVLALARLGYQVTASTGRAETHGYLEGLGATTVIDRSELAEPSKRPMEAERWAGCIDSVAGTTLGRVLAQTRGRGSIAAVGLAGGHVIGGSVMPFLLRGVNLLGIDSVMCPLDERKRAWQRLTDILPMDQLDALSSDATLADLPKLAGDILGGQVRGRIVVDVNA